MKNIVLIKPKLRNYYYEAKLNADPKTMSYNAGYDIDIKGYDYNTGCISFPKEDWKEKYLKRQEKDYFYAYIKDVNKNRYVGYTYYFYRNDIKVYECGIVIENKYRFLGYAKSGLKLLIREAYNNGIKELYDSFEEDRLSAIKTFLDVGFKINNKTTWKKFGKDVNGVVVKIKTNSIIPDIKKVKTLEDVLSFMKDNIRYGWLDINNNLHIGNMKCFRKLYRTLSIDEILSYGIGTCIDQVNLMHYLLNKINIKNKMFATRIYEPNDFNDIDADEHMHCFVLAYLHNKVYHIEHPNWYHIGIKEYNNEEEAIKTINDYYIKLSGKIARPVTEFYKIKEGISFKEFNNYINDLDITFRPLKDNKKDYLLLHNWCKKDFVYEWFEQRILSYDEIVKKYKKKLNDKIQECLIIRSNNKDIGYAQVYKCSDTVDNYKNIYEYDAFIGEEEYLNKGIGAKITNCLNDICFNKYHADAIIVRSFKRNERAIKCCHKCGFIHLKDYDGFDTLGNPEVTSMSIKYADDWKFGEDNDKLIKLVLDGKKKATTSLYEIDSISNKGDLSVIKYSNNTSACMVKIEDVIVTEFDNITWDLAKLEGESSSLRKWQETHIKYFKSIDKKFNNKTRIIFEIFKVIEKY